MVRPTNRTPISKFLIALMASASLAACSSAQTETEVITDAAETAEVTAYAEGPALWTLSDDDTVMHVFGFVPVLKADQVWKTETIQTAFDGADLLVVESNSSTPEAQAEVQALIPQLGVFRDGTTLSDTLSEAEQEEVNAVSTKLGAPLQAMNALKPWLASVQLGVLSVSQKDFDLANPPLAQLLSEAAAGEVPVQAFEGPADVMQVMAAFPQDEQVGLLLHAARDQRDNPDSQTELNTLWLNGDVEGIGTALHGPDGAWSSEAIYNAMLVDRNEAWTAQIKQMMDDQPGEIFVAVGFGHLAGPDSLINMLTAQGFEVTRK